MTERQKRLSSYSYNRVRNADRVQAVRNLQAEITLATSQTIPIWKLNSIIIDVGVEKLMNLLKCSHRIGEDLAGCALCGTPVTEIAAGIDAYITETAHEPSSK